MFDLLLKNGLIADGSGSPAQKGDIGIKGGKIAAVAVALTADAAKVIDLEGRTVAPGFIDIHRHADAALFRSGFGEAELRQGITTVVNGNCGMSIAPLPLSPERRREMLRFLAPVTGTLPDEVRFEAFSEYAALLKNRPLPLNVAALAGSGTIRAAAWGFQKNFPDDEALKKIHKSLEDALTAGAPGVSLGMSYMPDSNYTATELAKALAPLEGSGRPLVCHVRGEGDLLYESVEEVIEAARLLKTPLRISHFKCIGRRNWKTLIAKVITLIEECRQGGMRIDCDAYPWTAGSTQMLCLLPPAFLEGGPEAAGLRLRDSEQRRACREILLEPGRDFENIVYGVGWGSIYVSGLGSEKNRPLVGKSIAEIAAAHNIDPYDAAFDLLAEEHCNVTMVDYITCDEDIETILRLPCTSIISDAIYPGQGRPHPRNNSNISQVFHELVCRRRILTVEEAVHKLTYLPAEAMGLHYKGLLRAGFDADITVFRPENISPPADYAEPERLTSGIDYVFITGKEAVRGDKLSLTEPLTGTACGSYLAV
ncbi:dihydroorotase [Spirochaetia bacterium]|nr:dihydroorotase [Spirochaetia bacterium]